MYRNLQEKCQCDNSKCAVYKHMSETFSLEQQWQILQESIIDTGEFKPLYEFYYPKIFNFIYFRISHKETAEDLAGHVFMKLFEKIQTKKWASMPSFIKYMYVIARNTLKNHYRQHKDIKSVEPQDAIQETLNTDNIDLKQCMHALKTKDRELLYLHYFMGLTLEEIATMQGKNGSAVRMRHKRMLEKINKKLNA